MALRRLKHTVLYDSNVLEGLITDMQEEFPYEGGGFLIIDPQHVCTGFWHVRDYVKLEPPAKSRSRISFSMDGVVQAQKYALMRGLYLGGFFHSHPWSHPPLDITQHSEADERVQSLFDFPLSLVVGVRKDGAWSTSTWRNGRSAGLYERIYHGKQAYTFPNFLRTPYAREHPLWSQHLLRKQRA